MELTTVPAIRERQPFRTRILEEAGKLGRRGVSCRGHDITWRPIAGRGEIFSFTRVMHPFDKSRVHTLPYVVALVVFADAPGIRLITNIVDGGSAELRIGLTVQPVFGTDKNGQPVVNFRPA
jgi:uncharacterized protein